MATGLRNAVIILGIAALAVVWQRAFSITLFAISWVISILFVVAIAVAAASLLAHDRGYRVPCRRAGVGPGQQEESGHVQGSHMQTVWQGDLGRMR